MDTKNTQVIIKKIIDSSVSHIDSISEKDMSSRPAPGKWSKKEVIGHLCDSAINNITRFIRSKSESSPFEVTHYDQDEWVKAANYQQMLTAEIISFWKAANNNIIHAISDCTPEQLGKECYLDSGEFSTYVKTEIPAYNGPNGKRTILWLIDDYAAHMVYHLNRVFGMNL